jgi:hypothetical protein
MTQPRVEQLLGDRNLRRISKGKISDETIRRRSVAELQAHPAGHIVDCGVDVAGPVEVVRKKLGEGHLGCALWVPAITFGMIGRRFDGRGRVGRVLYAQRGSSSS